MSIVWLWHTHTHIPHTPPLVPLLPQNILNGLYTDSVINVHSFQLTCSQKQWMYLLV